MSARGERILFLDADGATEVADMERLEEALDSIASDHVSSLVMSCDCVNIFPPSSSQTQPAVVVGSRAHLQDEAVAQVSTQNGW